MRPITAITAGVSGLLLVLVAACAEQAVAPSDPASFGRRSPRYQPLIAFSRSGLRRGTQEIWTVDASGTQTRLTNKVDDTPVWSPDGSKLAFISVRDNNTEIYTMNPDGPGGEIYVMTANGSNPTRLTVNTGYADFLPAWSPDGSKIVFVSNREENKAHFSNDENDVYIMNPDGSGQTNLTTSSANDYFPRWSSDGQIAFVSFRDGNAEIYIMSADGSGQTNLTRNAASDNSPALKP